MSRDEQADALEQSLTEQERALLERVAEGIARRRLTAPALFLLESMQPLSFVASQAMVFFRPLMDAVLRSPETWDQITTLLARRGAIELLLRRLEARA